MTKMGKARQSMEMAEWYTRRTNAMLSALEAIRAELALLIHAASAADLAIQSRSTSTAQDEVRDLLRRVRDLAGVAHDACAADSRAVYEWTHQDHLESPWSHENAGASRPVGLEEIAAELGVQRATVDQWRTREVLPPPTWTVSGRPLWKWLVIEEWARATGRLDPR